VLASDAGRTVAAELDVGEPMICEESRVNVSSGDTTADVDATNNSWYHELCSHL